MPLKLSIFVVLSVILIGGVFIYAYSNETIYASQAGGYSADAKNEFASIKNISEINGDASYFAEPAPLSEAEAEIVFPFDYLQMESPALCASNGDYLLIYDNSLNVLFSVSGGINTYRPDASYSSVENLFILGDNAYIVADGGVYKQNLLSSETEFTEVTDDIFSADSYFYSDGHKLYVKTTSGYLSIYNSNLQPIAENVFNTSFIGDTVFSASDENLYIFSYKRGLPYLSVYNLNSNETKEFALDTALDVVSAVSSEGFIIAEKLASDNITELIVLSEEGVILNESKISPSAYAFSDNVLYVIPEETTDVTNAALFRYALSASDFTFTPDGQFSKSGSDLFHLDSPSDLFVKNGVLHVADTANNRILIYDASSKTARRIEVRAPRFLALGETNAYAAAEKTLYAVNSEELTVLAQTDFEITDIAAAQNLYVLSENALFIYFANELYKIADIDGAKSLFAQNNVLYVLTDSDVRLYDSNGHYLRSCAQNNFTTALSVKADAAGNVFALYRNKIEKYVYSASQSALSEIYSLETEGVETNANNFFINGNTAYFCANESYVGKIGISAQTEIPPQQLPEISASDAEKLTFIKLSSESSYYYDGAPAAPALKYFDDSSAILAAFPSLTENDDALSPLIYVLYGRVLKLFPRSDFDVAAAKAINAEYMLTRDSDLFLYPSSDAAVSLPAYTTLIVIDDAAEYGNGEWLRVEYQGGVFFAQSKNLTPATDPPDNKDNVSKAKTQASRIGGAVKVYASADINSDEIFSLSDGKSVAIISESNDFYLISFNGEKGYVLKSDVTFNALTKVQTMAIVLSVIIFITGTAIIISIKHTKRRYEYDDEKI